MAGTTPSSAAYRGRDHCDARDGRFVCTTLVERKNTILVVVVACNSDPPCNIRVTEESQG